MERISELKEEAYKIATLLMHEDIPGAGYVYNAETRLKAMEVYALLTSVEQKEKSKYSYRNKNS